MKNTGCFIAGTLVHTDKGLVPIRDLKVGDLVLSRNEDGSGDLVYKPIVRTFVAENVLVYAIRLSPRRRIGMEYDEIVKLIDRFQNYMLVTANHPFWVEGRGWVRVDQIQLHDELVLIDGTRVTLYGADLYGRKLESVYRTQDGIGFIPDYGDDEGLDGVFINLLTGEIVNSSFECKNLLNKLYLMDSEWKTELLKQLPENQRDHAEFYGFDQGHWRDPDTIQWGEDEGPLTTTVYNFEVADTHTYFVGKHGVWVHD